MLTFYMSSIFPNSVCQYDLLQADKQLKVGKTVYIAVIYGNYIFSSFCFVSVISPAHFHNQIYITDGYYNMEA